VTETTKLPTVGPTGAALESYMQMANLLNTLRAENRALGPRTEAVTLGGRYRFVDGQEHDVHYTWVPHSSAVFGLWESETLVIDKINLGGVHTAHRYYIDEHGNKQPGWSDPVSPVWGGPLF
jgi:hypothetical protein